MTAVWITIAALTATTAIVKGIGPVVAGARDLPPRALAVIALLAPALLAALVVVETLSEEGAIEVVDPRAAGVATTVAALALRAPVLAAIGLAVAVTAGLRALG